MCRKRCFLLHFHLNNSRSPSKTTSLRFHTVRIRGGAQVEIQLGNTTNYKCGTEVGLRLQSPARKCNFGSDKKLQEGHKPKTSGGIKPNSGPLLRQQRPQGAHECS